MHRHTSTESRSEFLVADAVQRLATSDARRAMMSRIRGRDTKPELSLRRAAWSLGLRYRLQYRIGKTRPDMVFVRAKLAVFADGCFWHGCPLHSTIPKNNREFWEQKLKRNMQRDADNSQSLVEQGWRVLRFWEHQIEASPTTCAQEIASILRHLKTLTK
ncbi:MAG: very short patch repair endonuclease [Comamonadaceae bacterium]|nr:MAG: very short patch repair endonuclease [Comamonadaceae bacterium]